MSFPRRRESRKEALSDEHNPPYLAYVIPYVIPANAGIHRMYLPDACPPEEGQA